jgi:hypothetical protein
MRQIIDYQKRIREYWTGDIALGGRDLRILNPFITSTNIDNDVSNNHS